MSILADLDGFARAAVGQMRRSETAKILAGVGRDLSYRVGDRERQTARLGEYLDHLTGAQRTELVAAFDALEVVGAIEVEVQRFLARMLQGLVEAPPPGPGGAS